jgi:hypothetical protein
MRARFVNPLQFMARGLVGLMGLLAGLLLTGAAQAQILDDVDWRRDGGDAVLQVRFVTGVQYLRSVVTRSNDQTLVFYRVLPTRQTLILSTAERRLDARGGRLGGSGLPGVIVTDEATSGRATDERRVLVRLATATKHRVRLGRGDRTLELVFEGLGDQLQPAPAAELPASATGRFRITLEGYEESTSQLSGVIPGSLQHLNVFTTRRVLNGKFFYETHLGPFTRRADAEVRAHCLARALPACDRDAGRRCRTCASAGGCGNGAQPCSCCGTGGGRGTGQPRLAGRRGFSPCSPGHAGHAVHQRGRSACTRSRPVTRTHPRRC